MLNNNLNTEQKSQEHYFEIDSLLKRLFILYCLISEYLQNSEGLFLEQIYKVDTMRQILCHER